MDGSKMRQDPKSPALSVGRSRSLRAEAAILKAATTLMEEKRPAQITAEAICKRAGVSKATLYKWWPSKIHVMLEQIWKRGVERGELRADTRSGLILDTLFGVLHYKQILGSHPVTEDTAKAVVDMIFSGIRTKDGSGS